MPEKINKKISKFKVSLVGGYGWETVRNLLVLKLSECQNEEDFNIIIESMLTSMFRSAEEMDTMRRKLGLKLLEKKDKEKMKEFMNGK